MRASFAPHDGGMERAILRKHGMNAPLERNGFVHPTRREIRHGRRSGALAGLIATTALAVCTAVAATVVSIGIARASAASSLVENESSVFAIALLLGLAFVGMGGITVLMLPGGPWKHHD